jgi:hypothetical protein
MMVKGLTNLSKYLVLAIMIAGGTLFLSCLTNADNEDPCDATKQDRIEPLLRIHLMVSYPNGNPFLGRTDFSIEKHYCSGTVSGHFEDSTMATNNGYWKPISTQYILENDEDYVSIEVTPHAESGAIPINFFYDYAQISYGIRIDEMMQASFEDTLHVTVAGY